MGSSSGNGDVCRIGAVLVPLLVPSLLPLLGAGLGEGLGLEGLEP